MVDDNEDAAELLAEALRTLGHEVRDRLRRPDARCGGAARFAPEVALLDIGLPVMDGYELAPAPARAARARRAAARRGDRLRPGADRLRSREAGFEEHLVKPVDLDDVAAMLRELA